MTEVTDKKAIVTEFLGKCNHYADGKIKMYEAQLDADPGSEEARLKLLKWQAYREYNEHAIHELQTSELDDWFK